MTASGPDDHHEQPEPRRPEPDLDEERRLLIEALTQAFAPAGGAPAREPGGTAQAPRGAQPEPGDGFAQPGEESAQLPGEGPRRGAGPATDSGADPGEAGGDDPAEGSDPTVGCACCGCRAPRACSVCPFCRSTAAALDPHVLERVADVATLLAEGLRAAAHRLSTEERDER